jgi:hypothetical protein
MDESASVVNSSVSPCTQKAIEYRAAQATQYGITRRSLMHAGALQILNPNLPPTVIVADTMIATAVLLALVGLVGLLQRRTRGPRADG